MAHNPGYISKADMATRLARLDLLDAVDAAAAELAALQLAEQPTHICAGCAEAFIAVGDVRCPDCGSDDCFNLVERLIALAEQD